jgi:alpha-amylase/alpha-mannosidase (GH57 family)
VDVETLEILAENGILFTVLAPHQARRVRPLGGRAWKEVTGARIDPRVPYTAVLPSKRKIHLFFYDGPVSRAVAFEKLLTRGETFAQRLMESFPEGAASPELVHIATDGETYGHHHRFGEMALSYAIRHIEEHGLARITNYGEHLQKRPPTQQVEIWEKTSWSCAHGVDRWWSDCGCNSGGNPGWNQTWRTPLRNALDWVREETARPYEEMGRGYFKDPWAARDGYIEVVLDRSADSVNRFFEEQSGRTLSPEERVAALKLLELQRHAMLMYTSCGWFFDELTGIETVQVLQYAGRAIQLAEDLFGRPFEPHFLGLLEQAPGL